MVEARRLRPRLLATARRYVGDDDAEDVVQDVLLRLWQMVDELRQPLDALASVLVRNQCVSLLRRQHRLATVVGDFAVSDGKTVGHSGGDETVGHSGGDEGDGHSGGDVGDGSTDERLERLMRVIERLPTMQQTVLRLRHVDGMEMRDIAAIVGTTEVAVRKTLSRARQNVRQQYQQHDDR